MTRQSEAIVPTMQTEASKTRSLEIAFVLDAESLRQLESLLQEVGDAFEYQVKFSDGHALQYRSVADVLKLPNSRSRSIVSLIAGVTGRSKQSAYVVLKEKITESNAMLGGSPSSPTIEYTISGTQKNVIYLGDKFDEWTVGLRQWYSIFYHGVLALLLVAGVIATPIVLWNYASPHLFSQAFLKSYSWLQPTIIVAIAVGEYWIFKLFPRATFAIGQGARRHELFHYLRTGVLSAFIVSVLASIVANWLTQHR